MIHDEVVTCEVAMLAKEKGFNNKCYHYYQKRELQTDKCFNRYNKGVDSICSAPTQSLLQRWLREEKKIYIAISIDIDHDLHRVCFEYGVCYDFDGRTMEYHNSYDSFGQYEDALEDALKWTLENLI